MISKVNAKATLTRLHQKYLHFHAKMKERKKENKTTKKKKERTFQQYHYQIIKRTSEN